jgi:hypothetical protein
MVKPKWKVKFKIPNVRPQNEIKLGNYKFKPSPSDPGNKSSDCYTEVEVVFETKAFNHSLPEKGEYEYEEQTIAYQHKRRIKTILDASIIISGFPLQVEIEKIELLNKEELEKSRVTLKRKVGISTDYEIKFFPTPEKFDEHLIFAQKCLLKRSPDDQEEIHRICRWLERGILAREAYDKFLYLWIGFNALYEKVGSGQNDAKKIESTTNLLDKNTASTLFQSLPLNNVRKLTLYTAISTTGKTDFSQVLSKELNKKPQNYVEILRLILRCIYCVRKELFHGNLSLEERDERVSVCNPLLEKIFRKTLELYVKT